MEKITHDISLNAGENEVKGYVLDSMTIEDIIAENDRRNAALNDDYDPIAGVGCCNTRVSYTFKNDDGVLQEVLIPETMMEELSELGDVNEKLWRQLRIKHDFEYWCASCVTILDKMSGRMMNLVLNRPQRRVLELLERQRLAKEPLRMIMLKARQWGGSTLVQMYMIWIQLVLKKNWNSVICGHLHQTSAAIKSMYNRVLRRYPKEFTPDGKRP